MTLSRNSVWMVAHSVSSDLIYGVLSKCCICALWWWSTHTSMSSALFHAKSVNISGHLEVSWVVHKTCLLFPRLLFECVSCIYSTKCKLKQSTDCKVRSRKILFHFSAEYYITSWILWIQILQWSAIQKFACGWLTCNCSLTAAAQSFSNALKECTSSHVCLHTNR